MTQGRDDREFTVKARGSRRLHRSVVLGVLLCAALLWRLRIVLPTDLLADDCSSLLHSFCFQCASWSCAPSRALVRLPLGKVDSDWAAEMPSVLTAAEASIGSVAPDEEHESDESLPDPAGVLPMTWWLSVPAAHIAMTTDSEQIASLVLARASSRAPPSVFA